MLSWWKPLASSLSARAELTVGLWRLEPHRSPETIEPLLELHLFLKKKNEKEGEKEESKRKKEEIQPP